MDDKRSNDRRKKKVKVAAEKRRGPRRLVCGCGGKIEVKTGPGIKESFICLRCGKEQ